MTFIFRDFVSKLFSGFVDSMTSSCCAPSDKFGLELEDPADAHLRNLAKEQLGLTLESIVDIGYGESYMTTPYGQHTDKMIDIDNNMDYKEEFKSNHFSDNEHRDLLIISGYLHELESLSDLTYKLHNISFGIKPILDLCLSFYYIQSRSNIHYILLIAEQCEEESEFIFPSMAPSDDDYDDGDRDGYSPRSLVTPGVHEEDDDDPGNIFLDNKDSTYGGLYYSSISSVGKGEKFWCHLYDLDDNNEEIESEELSIFKDEWIIKFAGCCTAKDIPLPSKIHKQLLHEYHHKTLQYKQYDHWQSNKGQTKKYHHSNTQSMDNKHWHKDTQQSTDDIHHIHHTHNHDNQHWHHHTRSQSHSHWRSLNNTLREYNVIFKLGGSGKSGWSNHCSAIIIDETSLNHTQPNTGNNICFFRLHIEYILYIHILYTFKILIHPSIDCSLFVKLILYFSLHLDPVIIIIVRTRLYCFSL